MSDDMLRFLRVPRSPLPAERVRMLMNPNRPILDQAAELVHAAERRGEITRKPPCTEEELAEAAAEGERLSELEYVHRSREKKRRMKRKED